MNKEQECIEKALQIKIASAKARLADLQKNEIPFENPIRGLSGRIQWEEKSSGKIKQILLLPLLIVTVLFMAILLPAIYITHLRDVQKKRQELKKEISELNNYVYDVPQDKTLLSLWRLHGLNKSFALVARISLVQNWINTLYGQTVTKDLNIESRVKESAKRHEFANQAYYERKKGAIHFTFNNPVDSVIRNLSDELPSYE